MKNVISCQFFFWGEGENWGAKTLILQYIRKIIFAFWRFSGWKMSLIQRNASIHLKIPTIFIMQERRSVFFSETQEEILTEK